jgi:hypothetical protein
MSASVWPYLGNHKIKTSQDAPNLVGYIDDVRFGAIQSHCALDFDQQID